MLFLPQKIFPIFKKRIIDFQHYQLILRLYANIILRLYANIYCGYMLT